MAWLKDFCAPGIELLRAGPRRGLGLLAAAIGFVCGIPTVTFLIQWALIYAISLAVGSLRSLYSGTGALGRSFWSDGPSTTLTGREVSWMELPAPLLLGFTAVGIAVMLLIIAVTYFSLASFKRAGRA